MSNRMDDAIWQAYRAGYIQATSEYGGPLAYERTVAEAEAHACQYADARSTPAASERAGVGVAFPGLCPVCYPTSAHRDALPCAAHAEEG